jgi:hypothetical protein
VERAASGQNAAVTPQTPEFIAHRLTSGRFVAFFIMGVTIYGAADAVRRHQLGDAAPVVLVLVGISLIAYVLGVRPAVIEDLRGIIVRNPVRTSEIPWGAVIDVDVVDVLRVHTDSGVVRCFSVPRRRPHYARPQATPKAYGFPSVPASINRADEFGATSGVSRADHIATRLREKSEAQRGTTSSAGGLVTKVATDTIVVLAGSGVAFVLAAVLR